MTEQALHAAVHELMLRNVKDGYSGLLGQHYCYIAPALRPYPFQWFWDTCFHVVILARLGEFDLAKRNLRSLFAMQEESGFVGHMIFWKQVLPQRRTDVMQARPTWEALRPHMSALVQPPLAAVALHTLFEACPDRVFLGEMYARIRRHDEWLAKNRDFDGDGLLTIISPFESGMDWKASYDPVLGYRRRKTPRRLYLSSLYWKAVSVDLANFVRRYDLKRIRERRRFLVKDAGFNAIYAVDLECMERLAPIVGDDPAIFAARRRRLIDSMLRLMYDEADATFHDLREPRVAQDPGSHADHVLSARDSGDRAGNRQAHAKGTFRPRRRVRRPAADSFSRPQRSRILPRAHRVHLARRHVGVRKLVPLPCAEEARLRRARRAPAAFASRLGGEERFPRVLRSDYRRRPRRAGIHLVRASCRHARVIPC
jgi:hypothetical protein